MGGIATAAPSSPSAARPPDGPPPGLRFKRRLRLHRTFGELWAARELVRALAERDLRARYKQAVLGFAWAVMTPIAMMVVFTLVFDKAGKFYGGGAPYPLFAYLGLITWSFFSTSVNQGAMSLATNLSLLNKVYCPREVFPLATLIVAGVDMVISLGVLAVLFLVFWTAPALTSFSALPLLLILFAFTYGVTLIFSVSLVYLRDLRHILPIIMQMGVFATPVAYELSKIPQKWQLAYCAVNPLGAVIQGMRDAVLYGRTPAADLTLVGAASAAVWLVVGYLFFKKLETGIADVA